jgi:hypothetical protein
MRTIFSTAASCFIGSVILVACAQNTAESRGANNAAAPAAQQGSTAVAAGQPGTAQAPAPSVEKADGGGW